MEPKSLKPEKYTAEEHRLQYHQKQEQSHTAEQYVGNALLSLFNQTDPHAVNIAAAHFRHLFLLSSGAHPNKGTDQYVHPLFKT